MGELLNFPASPADSGKELREQTDLLEAGANLVAIESLRALKDAEELHRRLTRFPWTIEDTDPPEPVA